MNIVDLFNFVNLFHISDSLWNLPYCTSTRAIYSGRISFTKDTRSPLTETYPSRSRSKIRSWKSRKTMVCYGHMWWYIISTVYILSFISITSVITYLSAKKIGWNYYVLSQLLPEIQNKLWLLDTYISYVMYLLAECV